MGRLRAKTDYVKLRKARILDNQARIVSLGVQKTKSELKSITSSEKSEKTHLRRNHKVDYSSTPLRRSSRLLGKSCNSEPTVKEEAYKCIIGDGEKWFDTETASPPPSSSPPARPSSSTMGRLRAKTDYEELRKARILENQARLVSLGVQKTISELKSITSSAKSEKAHLRRYNKVDYSSTPLRRSSRLLGGKSCNLEPTIKVHERPANAPLTGAKKSLTPRFSPEALARRCTSKDRGSLYDPIYGICCHFCRQKKLCGEEDCKHCGNLDLDQPCIGKTDCSVCHFSNGVLCRGCLKVRYGEELEDVRTNEKWMCPHCIEEKGTRPYWICNSSFCLQKRKMAPTGIAIFRAREMGYKSVAHFLIDELQRAEKQKS